MGVEPEGEEIRKAVQWIADEKRSAPEKPMSELIAEACLRFDLSPLEAEFLQRKQDL